MEPLHIEVIDRAYAAILATKTPAEKISMVAEANRMARDLAAAGVRYLHPGWSEEQIQAEVARRMLHEATRPEKRTSGMVSSSQWRSIIIDLTDELWQLLSEHPDEPVRVVDSATQKTLILVNTEVYDRLTSLYPDDIDQRIRRAAAQSIPHLILY